MTHSDAEQLALYLHELIERQTVLRAALERGLHHYMTAEERADTERSITAITEEIAALEARLAALRPAAGGTG